ncbi:hypothetical protein BCR35DRAFT_351547, partial [Leucosporidium creatinivorum]
MLFFSEESPLTEVPLSPKPIYQGQWSPRLPHPHKKVQRSPLKTALVGGSLFAALLLLGWRLHGPSSSPTATTSTTPSHLSALSAYFRPAAAPSPPSCPPPSTLSPSPAPALAPTSSATASCEPCISDPSNPLCVYGMDNIRLSRSFEGSGHRVRKVLEKALRGEVVRIGVLGASVTAGHGLDGKQKWQDRFFEDFVKMFPNAEIYDGAASGMNSAFFGYCFDSLVPRDLDLYLLELDVNNVSLPLLSSSLPAADLHFLRRSQEMIDDTFAYDDTLFRGLLGLPQEPAVIRVSVFALAFEDLARGLVSNLLMSNFFDVPIISVRNFLLPHLIANPDEIPRFFSKDWEGKPDLRHISHLSHQALGDMLALYMKEKTCETKRRLAHPPPPADVDSPWPPGNALGDIPRLYLWEAVSSVLDGRRRRARQDGRCFQFGSSFYFRLQPHRRRLASSGTHSHLPDPRRNVDRWSRLPHLGRSSAVRGLKPGGMIEHVAYET